MTPVSTVNEYIKSLKSYRRIGDLVVYHQLMPEKPATWGVPKAPWPDAINKILNASGISKLYSHQSDAMDLIRSNASVVVATPTASGKTLIYTLPVLEKILKRPKAKALYIFPLKALAQDQLRVFHETVAHLDGRIPTAAIYDGDTSAWHRKRIRETPPNIILTNPEMVHLSFLPHHDKWAEFFTGLEVIVVDEVHTYRGVMGSHMAQVFRRLKRVCAHYGADPAFLFSSATVSNPDGLPEQLIGIKVEVVTKSGAPRGRKHLVFINPIEGPAQTAIILLKAALRRNLRTIVYTQSRKMTELIAIWAGNRAGEFSNRISAYRAGFLPEERRRIERQLADGDLLAVISTSALELGIDIGNLDLCILVGYPGSIIATWQRGGRVGRTGQESALVLIAGEDALDQYLIRNPEDFLSREPEAAVINPFNPNILSKHLACAASELPLNVDEPMAQSEHAKSVIKSLETDGALLRSAEGDQFFSREKAPQRHVDLRGSGDRYQIMSIETGDTIGEVDGFRAFKETHPGAIYLHRGETFLIRSLEPDTKTVKAERKKVDYYTRYRGHKDTEILEIFEEKKAWGTRVFLGRLKVTDQVTGYERWRIHVKKRLNIVNLDLPPLVYETEGLWYAIPAEVQRDTEASYLHFMGGIHAIEHAGIGIFPLLVLTDRNDLGGISIPFHQQVGSAAIFIYDGVAGGAGLTRQAFDRAEDLLNLTLKAIETCPCESGCPSCVQSPKCGSGNRPIDKTASVFIIKGIMKPRRSRSGLKRVGTVLKEAMPAKGKDPAGVYFCVLDIETQRSAEEVGGWHRIDRMGLSCAVLYDSKEDAYTPFREDEVPELIDRLKRFELVVGFNINRFDYTVLRGYSNFDFKSLPTLDILEDVHRHLGFRLSLDHLAGVTLGKNKTADGLAALKWWKEGKIEKIIDYCRADVKITKALFGFGKKNGYLLFTNKAGNQVRVPVSW